MLRSSPIFKMPGFTLIELMIGIAIMALVLAVGMPSYGVWIQNSRLRNAAESILNGLQLARTEAVTRNTSVQFALGVGSNWTVGCTTVTSTCPTAIQSRAAGEGSSAEITVTSEAGATIVFNNLGRMTSPALPAGATSIAINVDTTALPAADSRDLRITVDGGGNVRMCDPNVVTPNDARAC